MDTLDIRVLRKRQQLKDMLRITLEQTPTLLNMVRVLKEQINFCDYLLEEIYARRVVRKTS